MTVEQIDALIANVFENLTIDVEVLAGHDFAVWPEDLRVRVETAVEVIRAKLTPRQDLNTYMFGGQ